MQFFSSTTNAMNSEQEWFIIEAIGMYHAGVFRFLFVRFVVVVAVIPLKLWLNVAR